MAGICGPDTVLAFGRAGPLIDICGMGMGMLLGPNGREQEIHYRVRVPGSAGTRRRRKTAAQLGPSEIPRLLAD